MIIRFSGGDLNGFQDIKPCMSEWGGACPGTPWGTSKSVLLNASYHKKHNYIWVRGGI